MVPLQGAIGREGDHQLSGSGRGAIAGCHCSVLWVGEEGDQLWGRGAIAGCHCSVLWCGEGRVSTNFRNGRGAIAGRHCSWVPV